jgi:hypothetical protein
MSESPGARWVVNEGIYSKDPQYAQGHLPDCFDKKRL